MHAGSCSVFSLLADERVDPEGEMNWSDILYHPVWICSTALLAFVVRLQRRGRWYPQACTVRLKGKTAIVTGANTGWFNSTLLFTVCGGAYLQGYWAVGRMGMLTLTQLFK